MLILMSVLSSSISTDQFVHASLTAIFQVYVRFTTDNWQTNTETAGRYNSSDTDDAIDKFTFIISLPTDFPVLCIF